MYCFKWNTESKTLRAAKTKNGEPMLLLNYVVCGTKKLRVTREQKASAFLDSVGIRTGLDEVLLVSPILL